MGLDSHFRGLTGEKTEELLGAPAVRDSSFRPETQLFVFDDRGEVGVAMVN